MGSPFSTENLENLIASRDFNGWREQVKNWSANDLAELIEPLSTEKQAILFRLLPRELAAKVYSYLSPEHQEGLLRGMAREEVATMFNAMPPDDRTSILEELPANVIQQMLNLLSPQERTVASQLLGYDEDSVGRLMTPDDILCT
jgi:magnesium transporter